MKRLARWIALGVFTPLMVTHADILSWDGGDGDGLLGTAANWNPDQAPAGGDTLNISGATVSHEDNLPPGVTINLTGNATLQPVTQVLRLAGSTINVGSGSTLTGGSFGFDFGGGNLAFDDGAIATMPSWEQKGNNTITFILGASGFTTMTPGTLRMGGGLSPTTWADATYQVDFAAFTAGPGSYNITLLDFGGDATNSIDADFQNATFNWLNQGPNISAPALTWSDGQDTVTLSFTAVPEPSTGLLVGLAGLVLFRVVRASRPTC